MAIKVKTVTFADGDKELLEAINKHANFTGITKQLWAKHLGMKYKPKKAGRPVQAENESV